VNPVRNGQVEFLNRQLYPNGKVGDFWEFADIQAQQPQLVVLHNNWIKGKQEPPLSPVGEERTPKQLPRNLARVAVTRRCPWWAGLRGKIRRLIDHGLWFLDREKEICSYAAKPSFAFDWSVDESEEE
jgi:hypothetical protein